MQEDIKKKWVDTVMGILFNPEHARLDKMLDDLIQKHIAIVGVGPVGQVIGLTHCGERHVLARYQESFKRMFTGNRQKTNAIAINQMVPSPAHGIAAEFGAYVADYNKIQLDKKRISQVLYKLIYQAANQQELRDAFPECIVQLIPSLSALPRTMTNPYFMIQSDQRAVREYEKILPRIEFYAMTRLIY